MICCTGALRRSAALAGWCVPLLLMAGLSTAAGAADEATHTAATRAMVGGGTGAPAADAAASTRPWPPGDAQAGQRLYMTGQRPDGSPLPATRAGTGRLPAAGTACVGCHRPSGRGGSEGGVRVPSIAGPVLFVAAQPPDAGGRRGQHRWLRHQTRSAYDLPRFARALAQGVDPDGQPLATTMPRYQLSAQELADLAAFLRQRGAQTVPGLDGRVMHLATVVTPGAPPARRQAVQQAMAAWAKGMGVGPLRVDWQVWPLVGEPATWPQQLQAHWRRRPVYALLSGAGGDDWAPVQAFCQLQQLPCLFPQIDRLPPGATQQDWTVYLSAGLDGEATMLAQRLPLLQPARLVQVVDSPTGEAVARQLQQRLAQQAPPASESSPDRPLPGLLLPAAAGEAFSALANELPLVIANGSAASASANASASALRTDDWVVLWLPGPAALVWLQARDPHSVGRVVLSAQLAPPELTAVPPAWRSRVLWVSMRADPVRQQGAAALSLVPWLQRLGLPDGLSPADLADVHAATFFFADALAQTRGVPDPPYLLERLEVAVDLRPAGGAYFRLSLGPGQRIAAQGGHLLGFRPPDFQQLAPLAGFIRAVD